MPTLCYSPFCVGHSKRLKPTLWQYGLQENSAWHYAFQWRTVDRLNSAKKRSSVHLRTELPCFVAVPFAWVGLGGRHLALSFTKYMTFHTLQMTIHRMGSYKLLANYVAMQEDWKGHLVCTLLESVTFSYSSSKCSSSNFRHLGR